MRFITDGISSRKLSDGDLIPDGWRYGRIQRKPAWNKGLNKSDPRVALNAERCSRTKKGIPTGRKGKKVEEIYGEEKGTEFRNNRFKYWENKKDPNTRFDIRYKKYKEDVHIRDENKCQDCGKENLVRKDRHIHHDKDWNTYPELRYVLSNSKTVCSSCHSKIERQRKWKQKLKNKTAA